MEFVNDLYLDLLQQGWKLHDIDQMDMIHFMRVQVHAIRKQQKQKSQVTYIDQLGIFQ